MNCPAKSRIQNHCRDRNRHEIHRHFYPTRQRGDFSAVRPAPRGGGDARTNRPAPPIERRASEAGDHSGPVGCGDQREPHHWRSFLDTVDSRRAASPCRVTPAKAGVRGIRERLDSGFRRNDGALYVTELAKWSTRANKFSEMNQQRGCWPRNKVLTSTVCFESGLGKYDS